MAATAFRTLYANWIRKVLQVSDKNGGAFQLPDFNKYETVPLKIIILQPASAASGIERYERLDISPLSLQVAINDTYDDASPLAYQNVWTKDETDNVFSGELSLNTAALNTYLGSESSKAAYFEISISEGTARTLVYLAAITLKNSVLQVGSVAPAPVDEYYTKSQADSQFVRKIEDGFLNILSPSGNYMRTIGVDDGGTAIDQILPYPPV